MTTSDIRVQPEGGLGGVKRTTEDFWNMVRDEIGWSKIGWSQIEWGAVMRNETKLNGVI